ncbi:hypothetical protein RO575_16975 [Methylomonas sp. MO1]|uniref:hypothetical protein n=1 Tax=Methylomonas sp. MO1 TaxID=3073619 RepID=UPI0028A42EFF|nr:hypothetical protein [Methylomonas sp. MO1]MDT4291259.1 hypothetical protein [Methylomonas sp. MO1]
MVQFPSGSLRGELLAIQFPGLLIFFISHTLLAKHTEGASNPFEDDRKAGIGLGQSIGRDGMNSAFFHLTKVDRTAHPDAR